MAKSSKKKQRGKIKSSKSSTKKDILQKQLQNIIMEANAHQNPLEILPPTFLSVPLSGKVDNGDNGENNDLDNDDNHASKEKNVATIRHFASPLPPHILKQCLELFKTNMGDMYRHSTWGLDMEEKLEELQHSKARFLVVLSTETVRATLAESNKETDGADNVKAKNSDNDTISMKQCTVLGFCHFRYDLDEDDDGHPKLPITYLYELQIHPTVQKLGLGKKLMTIIELMSLKLQMKKVMLTVFHSNEAAMGFYKKRNYHVDECSPSNFSGEENENCDYEIMSKSFE
eukprot:CAMPEP_0172321062 /NCGR_PEP_ID=MMETSP1058-20130122/42172_1 /TAXON_ID=83371 /ORGANISM="Detonula confervacea, Strain CCMP 353" /LENGTH=286 /DNA_ID=CAMNT_0013036463 /DNA_START=266 /DNA_END=1126 /DNA_ORIENTATION=-